MGILSGLKHWIENAGTPDQQTGLSGWDKLGAVGAGLQNIGDPEGGDRLAPYKQQSQVARASVASKEQANYLDELAQRVGLGPKERLLMRVSPEKAAEFLSKALSPTVVSKGSQVYSDGEFQAPTEYGFDQGRGYSLGPEGFSEMGRLDPSFKETSDHEKALQDAQMELQKFQEDQRRNRVTEGISAGHLGVARGNLGLSRERMNREGPAGLGAMTTEQLVALAQGLK